MFSREQYRALRDGAGLVDRSDRGRLLLTGVDRRSYLQGLLTNDIEALAPGTGCYAALLTPQGRMIADMRVLELGEAVSIDLEPGVAAAVRDRLDHFIFSEDVHVADATRTRTQLGVYGPLASDVIARALVALARSSNGPSARQLEAMTIHANVRTGRDEAAIDVVRSDDVGVRGFDLFARVEDAEEIRRALRACGAMEIDAESSEVCRIEAGRPLFGVDMDEDTIPLEAGIEDRAISLTKGCYVGQEIIIRVLHRGHGRVARRLVGLTLEGSDLVPARDDPIRSGEREVGRVTSAAVSPGLGRTIALGYVHRDFAAASTAVTVMSAGRETPARVTELPFVART